jgi:hypothetical protein
LIALEPEGAESGATTFNVVAAWSGTVPRVIAFESTGDFDPTGADSAAVSSDTGTVAEGEPVPSARGSRDVIFAQLTRQKVTTREPETAE